MNEKKGAYLFWTGGEERMTSTTEGTLTKYVLYK